MTSVLLPSGGAGHQDDQTLPNMTAGVFEAKYELDSLAGTIYLSLSFDTPSD
jgi:meiotically up-regulated gene 157 (Mug157) protein